MSNNNKKGVTTDSVNNGTKYYPSQYTTKCSDLPKNAASFSSKVMSSKTC